MPRRTEAWQVSWLNTTTSGLHSNRKNSLFRSVASWFDLREDEVDAEDVHGENGLDGLVIEAVDIIAVIARDVAMRCENIHNLYQIINAVSPGVIGHLCQWLVQIHSAAKRSTVHEATQPKPICNVKRLREPSPQQLP